MWTLTFVLSSVYIQILKITYGNKNVYTNAFFYTQPAKTLYQEIYIEEIYNKELL